MASDLQVPVAGGPAPLAGFQVAGPSTTPCRCGSSPHGTHGILYRILRRDDAAEDQEHQGGRDKDHGKSYNTDRSPVEEEAKEVMGGGTAGEAMGNPSPQSCPLRLQRPEQQKQRVDFQHYLDCQHQQPNNDDLELHNAWQQNHETHCHLDRHPGDDNHPHRHQERDDESRHRRGRQRCGCGVRRRVLLRSPRHTWRAASAVLLKTARFVRNLPAFGLLPGPERTVLLTSAWAPLFLLGLAQERVAVDAAEEVSSGSTSLLRTLLTGQGGQSDGETDTNETTSCGRLTMVDIQKIRTFLAKFWSMDISAKEYGYLKGIVLFNPDSPGLQCWPHVQTLQREAQRALSEACGERPSGGGAAGGRLARLLLTLAQLHSIRAEALTELFFRPVFGPVNVANILLDMLDAK
uniref:nuclear receptor subfamily 0 group B member 2-like n=1 Tax=Myxine glutinosa TaxID=7769 RepID=UPI00358F2C21